MPSTVTSSTSPGDSVAVPVMIGVLSLVVCGSMVGAKGAMVSMPVTVKVKVAVSVTAVLSDTV